jgi:hypothetical protein
MYDVIVRTKLKAKDASAFVEAMTGHLTTGHLNVTESTLRHQGHRRRQAVGQE